MELVRFTTLALALTSCLAAKVTFYGVATQTTETLPLSQTFVPLGVGPDGATTYSEESVESLYYIQGQHLSFSVSGGKTLSSTVPQTTYSYNPITFHATLVADASHFSYHQDPQTTGTFGNFGENADCKFDGKGGGVCVDEIWFDGGSTLTTTITGVAVPYYTLSIADSQTKGNGAVPVVVVGSIFAVTVFGVIIGQVF